MAWSLPAIVSGASAQPNRRQRAGTAARSLAGALVLCVATVSGAATALASTPPCSAPEGLARLGAPTPVLVKAMKDGAAVRIVAFGSSSTEGAGASARDRAYPARLGAALRRMLPDHSFQIVNRGRGGELASDMLARMERDVIAEAPTLVIWQTGVNDAIRGIDMETFQAQLEDGLERLKAAGIDVVLLDHQYYPRAEAVKDYRAYLALLRRIGAAHNVPVFQRYQLMTHLVKSGQFQIDDLLAPDRFHQNDLSYNCLGAILAEAIRVRLDRASAPALLETTDARGQ
jgi:acyl-CoA thioesterase-1